MQEILNELKEINRNLQALGFGDSINIGGPNFGAIEGLTMKICENLESLNNNLERIADALEQKGK